MGKWIRRLSNNTNRGVRWSERLLLVTNTPHDDTDRRLPHLTHVPTKTHFLWLNNIYIYSFLIGLPFLPMQYVMKGSANRQYIANKKTIFSWSNFKLAPIPFMPLQWSFLFIYLYLFLFTEFNVFFFFLQFSNSKARGGGFWMPGPLYVFLIFFNIPIYIYI